MVGVPVAVTRYVWPPTAIAAFVVVWQPLDGERRPVAYVRGYVVIEEWGVTFPESVAEDDVGRRCVGCRATFIGDLARCLTRGRLAIVILRRRVRQVVQLHDLHAAGVVVGALKVAEHRSGVPLASSSLAFVNLCLCELLRARCASYQWWVPRPGLRLLLCTQIAHELVL
jgi:hypothetical protein